MQIATHDEEPVSAPIEENGPMRMNHESSLPSRWIVFGTALVYFALGSLLTVHFMQLKEVWADSHRVFQQQIYHAVPGKVPALERALLQRFQMHTLQARLCVTWRKTRSRLPPQNMSMRSSE
jgi:hypothetical protein